MLSSIITSPTIRFANWLPRLLKRYNNSSVTLKDGTTVYLRQVCAVDANLVYQIYTEMSEDSLFRRFNTYPSLALIRNLAEQTAVQAEEAGFGLLAYVLDDEQESGIRPLGLAYYIANGSDAPEFAVSIVDASQNKGLGKTLVAELFRRAKKAGLTFLQAYVLPINVGMRLLIQRAGKPFFYGEDGAYDTYKIVL